MLEQEFERLYLKFRLMHYQELFARFREKRGSLSATDASAAEVIFLLKKPTVKEFADFLNISQPNATYKVNTLIQKGYIIKYPSSEDRREYRLDVTDKFLAYYGNNADFIKTMIGNIRSKFTQEEIDQLEKTIKKISDEALI